MTDDTDPRPLYRDVLAWVRGLTAHVPADRFTGPTPSSEWNVRELLGHLLATVGRAQVIGEGGDPDSMPSMLAGVPDDGWSDALVVAEDEWAAAWTDDATLDAPAVLPWGRAPGRVAMWGYTGELLVHGWDLAVATGQDVEADPATATAVLAEAKKILPAEPRGGFIPFAAPVEPRPGAGPTEQLANWCGHARG